LADVRVLRTGGSAAAEELLGAPAAPANLTAFQQQFGKELAFTVTGYTPTVLDAEWGGQFASLLTIDKTAS